MSERELWMDEPFAPEEQLAFDAIVNRVKDMAAKLKAALWGAERDAVFAALFQDLQLDLAKMQSMNERRKHRFEAREALAATSPAPSAEAEAPEPFSYEAAWRNACARAEKLAAFKAYVHKRLDDAGVPVDPPSEHREHGCRIGGRLDLVLRAPTTPSTGRAEACPDCGRTDGLHWFHDGHEFRAKPLMSKKVDSFDMSAPHVEAADTNAEPKKAEHEPRCACSWAMVECTCAAPSKKRTFTLKEVEAAWEETEDFRLFDELRAALERGEK